MRPSSVALLVEREATLPLADSSFQGVSARVSVHQTVPTCVRAFVLWLYSSSELICTFFHFLSFSPS